MREEFKCMPDMPWYRIGTHGTIISDARGGKPKILKPAIDRYGYKKVTLFNNGKRNYLTVHRVVALTYLNNPDNLPQVNHKDGNKLNNYYKNLEWCTDLENKRHAHKNGLVDYSKVSGINHYNTELTKENILDIRNKAEKDVPYKEIAQEYGISKSAVSRIKLRQAYKNI